MKPALAITCGDPSGIGPEIVAKALRSPRVRRACRPVVFGAETSGIQRGRPSLASGLAAIQSLNDALDHIRRGAVRGLVTAPVSKESFALADYGFPGHTEFLAHEAGVRHVAMLMVAGSLRALLMTRHVPLQSVSTQLDVQTIVQSAQLAHAYLGRYVSPRGSGPRIVLCGLNPHAGDNGLIGTEESKVFRPALQRLAARGLRVAGPLPADSAFREMAEGRYDLALACYHDQGMIPLKLAGRERLVNITLGLPYIRTSPGHGTAYDIAGQNKADPRPMIEAILLAAHCCRREMMEEGKRTRR